MLAASGVIFLAASLALGLAWSRPSVFGRNAKRILVFWGGLVLPSGILALLVFSAFALGERLLVASGSTSPLAIAAYARQWQWEFHYPAAGGVTTTDVLHLPAGTEIIVTVTSADVIHSFWVPRLGGKIDAIPGHRNRTRLFADKPGTYGGICAEFCGVGHAPMRFTVVAHSPERYGTELARAANGGEP